MCVVNQSGGVYIGTTIGGTEIVYFKEIAWKFTTKYYASIMVSIQYDALWLASA